MKKDSIIKKFFELFDFSNWNSILDSKENKVYNFEVNNIKYSCRIHLVNKYDKCWEINFFKINSDLSVSIDTTSDHLISNKVFSNILSISKDFLSKQGPNIIVFKSQNLDRFNLYKRLGDQVSSEYGYTFNFMYYENTNNVIYYLTRYSNSRTERIIRRRKDWFSKIFE